MTNFSVWGGGQGKWEIKHYLLELVGRRPWILRFQSEPTDDTTTDAPEDPSAQFGTEPKSDPSNDNVLVRISVLFYFLWHSFFPCCISQNFAFLFRCFFMQSAIFYKYF